MATTNFWDIRLITVNRAVVQRTLMALQEFGSHQLEGLVLWLGEIGLGKAHVVKALVPTQHPISGDEGLGYFVSGETLFELNRDLASTGLRLIAQVHSHPDEAYHSDADDRYAIVTADGGFSLVVPDFGHTSSDPASWAVYRLNQGEWQALSDKQAQEMLKVCEDL
jgi:hypothetical protein